MKNLKDIEEEFVAQIHIPVTKPRKIIYVCPVGLIGAGKTTIIKPISEKLNLVRISSDELRKLLIENGHNYDSVKSIGLRVLENFVKNGYSVALDMDCGNTEVISFVKYLEKTYGGKSIWVHVVAPEEFIFNKFKNHEPSWLANNPQIMIDNYIAQREKRLKENTEFNFTHTFDTSKDNIPKQINLFLEKIDPTS